MPQLPPIRTEFLFSAKFTVDRPKILERTPFGTRIIAGVSGGSFEGPRLRGTVGPTGGSLAVRAPSFETPGFAQLLRTRPLRLHDRPVRPHRPPPRSSP